MDSIYTLIYGYIYQYLFNDSNLQAYEDTILGVNTNMAQWLSHSLTIIAMVLIFVFLVIFIKWIFKLVSGLFLLR